jgi:hypothetical protein
MKIRISDFRIKSQYIDDVFINTDSDFKCYLMSSFRLQSNNEEHKNGLLMYLEWDFSANIENLQLNVIHIVYDTFIKVVSVDNFEVDVNFIEKILEKNYREVNLDFKNKCITFIIEPKPDFNKMAYEFIKILVDNGNYPPIDLP